MVRDQLKPLAPLGGLSISAGGICLTEIIGCSSFSMIGKNEKQDLLKNLVKAKMNFILPGLGRVNVIQNEPEVLIMSLGKNYWCLRQMGNDPFMSSIKLLAADCAIFVDQSSSWVEIEIKGLEVRKMLERFLPIDIHPDLFPVGAVSQTIMDHINVIVSRKETKQSGEECFLLLSPRSSAQSFLHILINTKPFTG